MYDVIRDLASRGMSMTNKYQSLADRHEDPRRAVSIDDGTFNFQFWCITLFYYAFNSCIDHLQFKFLCKLFIQLSKFMSLCLQSVAIHIIKYLQGRLVSSFWTYFFFLLLLVAVEGYHNTTFEQRVEYYWKERPPREDFFLEPLANA